MHVDAFSFVGASVPRLSVYCNCVVLFSTYRRLLAIKRTISLYHCAFNPWHLLHGLFCVPGVPSPKRLFLERRFTRSVLVSWKPADLPPEKVKGYGVYVNGDLRFMIKGGDETKALLEDIVEEEVNSDILSITRVLSLENTCFLYPWLLSKVFTCNLIFKATSILLERL